MNNTTNPGSAANDGGIPQGVGGGVAKSADVYATINKELAGLCAIESDLIVFGPAEDFEYLAPLHDFQRSRSGQQQQGDA